MRTKEGKTDRSLVGNIDIRFVYTRKKNINTGCTTLVKGIKDHVVKVNTKFSMNK